MALKVLISAPYMLPIVDRFRPIFKSAGISLITPHVEERLTEDELLPYAGEVDGVICGDDRFTADVLEQFAPRLKVISKWGTGIDSIDQESAGRLGIAICNTPGAFTEPVADSVMAYILAFARRLPWIDQRMKAGQWAKIPGRSLAECTLGVVGVGKIGRAVLKRGCAFGMRLLGNDIIEIEEAFIRQVGVEMMPLHKLLAESDFVSLNCDLNPTSYHLLNREAFSHLQPQAVVINTARGPVVDEEALIEALQAGRIAGAGLDVYEDEPLPKDSPLRTMDDVLLAPHNANASPRAWERVHENTIRNLFQGLGLTWKEEFYPASE